MVDVAEAEMENSLDPDYVSKMGAAKDTLADCKYRDVNVVTGEEGQPTLYSLLTDFRPGNFVYNVINREGKCDVTKIQICGIMGLVNIPYLFV